MTFLKFPRVDGPRKKLGMGESSQILVQVWRAVRRIASVFPGGDRVFDMVSLTPTLPAGFHVK
jgi:hypothetical protein